jgi:heat shock protein HslJ
MTRHLSRLALSALFLLVVGCAGGGKAPAPGVTLENTTWTLVSLDGKPVLAPEGGEIPSVVFGKDPGRATGSSGCNTFAAPYTVDGDALTFGLAISTRKACPDMFLETAFLAGLESTATHRIEGHDLVLRDADGHEILRFNDSITGE